MLARGGQADIYDYGNGRVLRVPRRPQDYGRIRYEYEVYSFLARSGAAAPRVYELLDIEGAPAIVMQRIDGISMMDQIKKNPFGARRMSVALARLHLDLLSVRASAQIQSAKTNARYCILQSTRLSDDIKNRIVDLLIGMPDGDSLCHGDFHPGNLIFRDGKYYAIDWSNASAGDFHADAAHTYVLLRVVPRIPGSSRIMHFVQTQVGHGIARSYLRAIEASRDLHQLIFSRWVLIKAAERTYYGLPSEQAQLQRFIRAYLPALGANRGEERLYEAI